MASSNRRFIEVARGSFQNRGIAATLNDIPKLQLEAQKQSLELYRSYYFFDETLQDHLRAFKTVRGFPGDPIIEQVLLDVDKGTDTDEHTLHRARNVFHQLVDVYEVEDVNIRVFYSGRGFHIMLPNLWDFKTPDEVRETLLSLFPDCDNIYDKARLIRVANTLNYKTGRYKIPLEHGEFLNNSAVEIIDASMAPRNLFTFPEFEPHTKLAKTKVIPKPVMKNDDHRADDGFSPIVTCMQKLYQSGPRQGTRHISMLRMVSAFKRGGIPQSGIEVMMKEWAQGHLEVGEVRKVVSDVFKKNYSYSCHDEIMHQWCDDRCMFFKKKSFNAGQPESHKSLEDKLKVFALTGDENIIISLQNFLNIDTPFNIYRGELVCIFGDTGLGKSSFVQNIAVASKKRKILYLNFEVGEILMYRRKLQIAHGMTKDEVLSYYALEGSSTLASAVEHIDMVSERITLPTLESLVALNQYDIVIPDTLECFSTPGISEITPKTEHIAHELKRIAKKYNIVIMPVHHISKNAIQDPQGKKKNLTMHAGKGSKAVEDQSDKVILFEGDQKKPLRFVSSAKARDESPFETWLDFHAETTMRFTKSKEGISNEDDSSSNSKDRVPALGSNSSVGSLEYSHTPSMKK